MSIIKLEWLGKRRKRRKTRRVEADSSKVGGDGERKDKSENSNDEKKGCKCDSGGNEGKRGKERAGQGRGGEEMGEEERNIKLETKFRFKLESRSERRALGVAEVLGDLDEREALGLAQALALGQARQPVVQVTNRDGGGVVCHRGEEGGRVQK